MEWPKITHSLFSNMMQDFIMYEDRKKRPLWRNTVVPP